MMAWRKLRTYLRLGPGNLLRVALYRAGLRSGLHPVLRVSRELKGVRFYCLPALPRDHPVPQDDWCRTVPYFGWYEHPLAGELPDWHENPFAGTRCRNTTAPWWSIPDFDPQLGDIKTVWEPSRFDWILRLTQRAAVGSASDLERVNLWLADWCRANPAFRGPNWKCGQEASLRVLHLVLGAVFLDQDERPEAALTQLVEAHLARIVPTLDYALAQDNNHGTSEAAALFVGGDFCARNGRSQGRRYCDLGRRALENRAHRLIGSDGSFSQYSLNYHRFMLDALSVAEIWRRRHDLPAFSPEFRERASLAARWLRAHVDPGTGDGPNLGGNDGANLLPLTEAGYRDYRPAVQLALALFGDQTAYPASATLAAHGAWLGVNLPPREAGPVGCSHFPDGGQAVLRRGPWSVFLNYPCYRFRPRHCDALHVDVWYGGQNLCPDAGSFSYNAEARWVRYFPGTAAHNTVQFDEREQMPALGRFLRGDWLVARDVSFQGDPAGDLSMGALYEDRLGCRHARRVELGDDGVKVTDELSGFHERAVLRWRLEPGEYAVSGQEIVKAGLRVKVTAEPAPVRLELVPGWESRHYLQKRELVVLEVELGKPGTIVTEISAG